MTNTIYIEVDDRQALASLQRAADAIGDMPRVLRNVGEYLVQSTRDRFVIEESPDGVPWAALSPRYLKRKQRKYPGMGILRREDRMYEAIVAQVVGDTLLVGTNASAHGYPYPEAMQFGAPRANVPARPWLGLSDADRNEITEITLDYIRGALDAQTL